MKREAIIVPRKNECPYYKSFGYIYMFTNKTNGHKYIGRHKYDKTHIDKSYRGSGSDHWQNALKKYDWNEDFIKDILDWVEDDGSEPEVLNTKLNQLEMYYIDLFGTFENPDDYNMTMGGGGIVGHSLSKETRENSEKLI